MFEGYETIDIPVTRGTIHARIGGVGPPLLLLHGYPETHLMWHGVAHQLAERYTVVAADLPGYGASLKPTPAPDHRPHSKRAMAEDLFEAMAALGHERFFVAGHDRGGRVGYRMALDRPGVVTRLAVLDIVPTAAVWEHADDRLTLAYWHWGLLAAPSPLPEDVLRAGAFFDNHTRLLGLGAERGRYPAEVIDAYRLQFADPLTVQAICEDYRAGATIDRELDEGDRGRLIDCPLLVLWGTRGALPRLYDDVLGLWREWAADVQGRGLEATHFVVEDRPADVARELAGFLGVAG